MRTDKQKSIIKVVYQIQLYQDGERLYCLLLFNRPYFIWLVSISTIILQSSQRGQTPFYVRSNLELRDSNLRDRFEIRDKILLAEHFTKLKSN